MQSKAKKRATRAGSCLPIQVLLVSKQCKTAKSVLRNFLYKKIPHTEALAFKQSPLYAGFCQKASKIG